MTAGQSGRGALPSRSFAADAFIEAIERDLAATDWSPAPLLQLRRSERSALRRHCWRIEPRVAWRVRVELLARRFVTARRCRPALALDDFLACDGAELPG